MRIGILGSGRIGSNVGVRLTRAGRLFLEHARQVHDHANVELVQARLHRFGAAGRLSGLVKRGEVNTPAPAQVRKFRAILKRPSPVGAVKRSLSSMR